MTTFDQRNQKVKGSQFNAGGDINFGAVNNVADLVIELQRLILEISKAIEISGLNAEVAADVEAKVKKAVIHAKKPKPDKSAILKHLSEAKALLDGVASSATLITVLLQASESVKRLFNG